MLRRYESAFPREHAGALRPGHDSALREGSSDRASNAEASELSAPCQLLAGRYLVHDEIGRGGMASVHDGWDTRLERRVAIKRLLPSVQRCPGISAQFLREAQLLARVSHPNVMAVYDFGVDGDTPFMIMERLDGPTLSSELRKLGRVPLPATVELLGSILSALDAVHCGGIVHRDIKPENVIMVARGDRAVPVLFDFGIATPFGSAEDTGVVAGTPFYMAPEQASGCECDFRVDLYAVGVLAYECLTGTLPPAEHPPGQVLAKVRLGFEFPMERLGDHPELRAWFEVALARYRDGRFESARAMRASLEQVTTREMMAETTMLSVDVAALGSSEPRGSAPSLCLDDPFELPPPISGITEVDVATRAARLYDPDESLAEPSLDADGETGLDVAVADPSLETVVALEAVVGLVAEPGFDVALAEPECDAVDVDLRELDGGTPETMSSDGEADLAIPLRRSKPSLRSVRSWSPAPEGALRAIPWWTDATGGEHERAGELYDFGPAPHSAAAPSLDLPFALAHRDCDGALHERYERPLRPRSWGMIVLASIALVTATSCLPVMSVPATVSPSRLVLDRSPGNDFEENTEGALHSSSSTTRGADSH